MNGPDIIARSLSHAGDRPDKHGNYWQYHSRSDRHSKIACWAIMFDLVQACDPLRRHIELGEVAFGINHQIHDFKQNKKKDLDLVVCRPSGFVPNDALTFSDLAGKYGVILSSSEKASLKRLPRIPIAPVGSVLIALEAKAAMTEHGKAGPRFYDELNSSHSIVHGSDASSIAGGFVFVNVASTFVSPGRNPWNLSEHDPVVSHHKQPGAAEKIVAVAQSLPRRSSTAESGFDALGIVPVEMPNDGRRVRLLTPQDPPLVSAALQYRSMIDRMNSSYRSRYPQA